MDKGVLWEGEGGGNYIQDVLYERKEREKEKRTLNNKLLFISKCVGYTLWQWESI